MANKIYTRTGDQGETGLFGGGRVAKSHLRVCAYGEVDELNSFLGWVCAAGPKEPLRSRLLWLQGDLLSLGAHLATRASTGRPVSALPPLPLPRIAEMEAWMDEAEADLPPLRHFILPGGAEIGARLHLARTVCRRAERAVVALQEEEPGPEGAVQYLNRLSDFLFVAARWANQEDEAEERPWVPETSC